MIVARAAGEKSELLMMVLEPGNIAKLQLGQPIVKKLKEFLPELPQDIELMIFLCPDVSYLADRVRAGDAFVDALEKAMKRPEVYVRDHKDAEDLTRFL